MASISQIGPDQEKRDISGIIDFYNGAEGLQQLYQALALVVRFCLKANF